MIILSILLVALGVGAAIGMIHWLERKPWPQSLPDSISAMVYLLPRRGGWRWLWSVWLALVSVLTFAPVIDILDDTRCLGVMGFVPMVLLGFVAVWPLFDKEHLKWHYILSYIAGIWSQVDVWLMCPWWLFVWLALIVFVGYLLLCNLKQMLSKVVILMEMTCYIGIVGAIVWHLIN